MTHHDHSPFGADRFGQSAERLARFFGTPRYILGQTLVVLAWLALNGLAVSLRWDPYPFILLNLAFSTQAAYAAPLILLAQTRQADRDKQLADSDARHREQLADAQQQLLTEIHSLVRDDTPGGVQVLDAKLDRLLARHLGFEPMGEITRGDDW